MAKFHINKHGVPAPCKAKDGNCPYGGDEQHYNTYEEAQGSIDNVHEEEHGLLPGINESTLDVLVDFVGSESIVANFAQKLDEDELRELNEQLIEDNNLHIYTKDLSEQMLIISEEISYDKVLEEIEDNVPKEHFYEIIEEMDEAYNTEELIATQRDMNWQLRGTNLDIINSNVDLRYGPSPDVNIEELVGQAPQASEHPGFTGLTDDLKEVFTGYGKLGNHRVQYYKQALDMPADERVKIFTEALEQVTDGTEDKEEIDFVKRINKVSTEGKDEYTFTEMINGMNELEWGRDNRYFNKVDEALGINSKDGFISKVGDNESKSIYLDKEGIPEEYVEKQSIKLQNRKELYSSMVNEPRLTDALGEQYSQNMGVMNSLAKKVFNEEDYSKATSQKGSLKVRWERIHSLGVEKFGKAEFTDRMLQDFLEREDALTQLDKLDGEMNINSNIAQKSF